MRLSDNIRDCLSRTAGHLVHEPECPAPNLHCPFSFLAIVAVEAAQLHLKFSKYPPSFPTEEEEQLPAAAHQFPGTAAAVPNQDIRSTAAHSAVVAAEQYPNSAVVPANSPVAQKKRDSRRRLQESASVVAVEDNQAELAGVAAEH